MFLYKYNVCRKENIPGFRKRRTKPKTGTCFFFYKDNKTRQISALNTTFTGIYKQW